MNTKLEKAAVYHNAKSQVYDKLISVSQNLNKEQLLELFSLTITEIKKEDKQLFEAIYYSKNEDLAQNYSSINENHIEAIDKVGDYILSKQQHIENNNSLPNNILL